MKYLKEFAKDPNPDFKNSTTILIAILIIFGIGFFVIDAYRITSEQNAITVYNQAKNEQEWLQKFDFADNTKLLKQVLSPVKYPDVEKVQLEQINLIKKHNIMIKKIDNEKIKPPEQEKKVEKDKDKNKDKIKKIEPNYAQTSLILSGSWDNYAELLNTFEKNYLVVITDLKMDFDQKTGLINTSLKYRIYYD